MSLEPLEDRIVPATYYVVNLADAGNGNNNAGDLRYCINGINASKDATNTILFQAGMKPLTGTINLQKALPAINNNVTVSGSGASNLTVAGSASANNPYSVFTVNAGKQVSINGLTITGGYDSGGGGILNLGILSLSNDVIENNTATGNGGGVNNGTTNSQLSLLDDLIQLNNAGDSGGGLSNFGSVFSLEYDATDFISNTAKNAGGGIYNDGKMQLSGDLIQTNSVNSTSGERGGVYNAGIGVSFTFTGTINNNQAYQGGGLYNLGTAILNNTTVENCKANQGGGIYLGGNSSITFNTVTVNGNTLIGNNGKAAGIGFVLGAKITNNGLTDNDDPGGNPVQL